MVKRHYRLPSLNALAAFEAVARQLSMTRAAEEMNVTPGAISRQVRHLESDLGRPLLRRHHNGVSLTTEGEAVAATLHESFERISAILQQVRTSGGRAHVSIVTTMATMQLWLMPRLGSFWNRHQESWSNTSSPTGCTTCPAPTSTCASATATASGRASRR